MDIEEFVLIPLKLCNHKISSLDKTLLTNTQTQPKPNLFQPEEKEIFNQLSFAQIKNETIQSFLEEKEAIFNILNKNSRISFSQDRSILLDNNDTGVDVGQFLDLLLNKYNKQF